MRDICQKHLEEVAGKGKASFSFTRTVMSLSDSSYRNGITSVGNIPSNTKMIVMNFLFRNLLAGAEYEIKITWGNAVTSIYSHNIGTRATYTSSYVILTEGEATSLTFEFIVGTASRVYVRRPDEIMTYSQPFNCSIEAVS